jgi:hypothetical protein
LLAAAVLVGGSTLACAPADPDAAGDAAQASAPYVYTDSVSGIVVELPANWRGRFQVAEGITDAVEGLLHEVALRYVQEDSSVATERPLLIARVFDRTVWQQIGNDSTAERYGLPVGGNETRTLLLRPARDNPFTPATADALGYDSLMLALFDRPFRATVRMASGVRVSPPDAAR